MKQLFTLTFLIVSTTLSAQETEEVSEKKFSVTGSLDAYFRTNLTASDTITQSPASFADQTGFALGMANVIASYENGKVGAVADLVFGPRGDQAVGSDALYVNQLYAYWNLSKKTTLTFGRFNTFLGYEVISPTGNFNYSTSYLFASGPFSHVGLKADFELSDDFSLMLAVMNPTDTNNNATGDYAFGAQLGYSGQYLNLYYDSKAVLGFEIDYTGGFDISDDFYLGINAAYQDNDGTGFYGGTLYPQYRFNETFALGFRGEYFAWHGDGNDLPSAFDLTLTGSYSVDDLTIKPEIRFDSWSNATPFYDSDYMPTESLASFVVAAIYNFN
ncbi:outer membrane beta-barrel protein [Psychroserpens ponticola]|uniref:Outer membrane beta-barrel protein n=1 Tax=Psychroserpens ponticola TaxID=2932268 RepID=A0ABY7S2J2_9FLAO|nr:outer membrane beta-barrel protein [Psychroserpens ponticola]WCO02130.1 outer membrane beta-barrel protein [Psychroserpens ponticola]